MWQPKWHQWIVIWGTMAFLWILLVDSTVDLNTIAWAAFILACGALGVWMLEGWARSRKS